MPNPSALRLAKKPKDLSSKCLKVVRARPNALVPHYLIHSFLYYKLETSVITDAAFDEMVSRLEAQWDSIEHRHKGLLDRSFLKSGFHIQSYPGITTGAAFGLLAESMFIKPEPLVGCGLQNLWKTEGWKP